MRRELKYLVRETDRDRLYALVAPFVRPDAHAGGAGRPSYTVRSVYFDTPDLRDYAEKQSGIQVRKKLRVRAYNLPQPGSRAFLEIKRKNGRAVWKDRATLPPDTIAQLLNGAPPEGLIGDRHREAANRFLFLLRRERRCPTLLVTYDREPLVGRFDPSLRITLDRRLRCKAYPTLGPNLGGLYSEQDLQAVFPHHFILEVKFDRTFPSWLRHRLATLGLRQQALSKYGLGLEHTAQSAGWRFRSSTAVRSMARLRPAL